ncbi:MAG: hypothetical protein GY811_29345 [Myxococcales bacterium]|nr:hypothetical protein [Myxococcales bacterium]
MIVDVLELEEAGLAIGTESHRTHLYRAAVCLEKDGQRGPAVAIYDALIVLYTNTLQSSWALNKAAQLYESMGFFGRAARGYERHSKARASDRLNLLHKAVTFRLALEHDRQAEADTTLLIKTLLASGQEGRAAKAALALTPVFQRRGRVAERDYLREYLRRFGRRSSKKATAPIRARLAELRWGDHQGWRKSSKFATKGERASASRLKRGRCGSRYSRESPSSTAPILKHIHRRTDVPETRSLTSLLG